MIKQFETGSDYIAYIPTALVSSDVRAYEIIHNLGSDGVGAIMKITARRADGEVVQDMGVVDENGIARYILASNIYEVPGELRLRLQIIKDDSVLTKSTLYFRVEKGDEKTLDPETEVPILDKLLLKVNSIESDLPEMLDKKADKEDIEIIEAKLDKKANKSDIVSAYRFCGSVENVDDLPVKYDLIPNGVPTHNGEVCGTYDEETHTVTIDNVELVEVDSDRIIIPIVPIEVKGGKYLCEYTYFGNAYIGDLCTYVCGASGGAYETLAEGTISYIEIFTPYGEETISGSTNNLGVLPRIIDSWIEDDYYVYVIPTGAYDAGAVYEVIDSGMSYGWTGSTWDALGTSHIDQEARANIEQINTELNTTVANLISDVDEANNKMISLSGEINNKANKYDIVSAYRFCGSVETVDDLPWRYDLIPTGAPYIMIDGEKQEVGTYEPETHTVTISESTGGEVIIPISPITIKNGLYFCDNAYFGDVYIGDEWLYTPECSPAQGHSFVHGQEGLVVDKVITYCDYSRSSNNLGTLYKALPTWYYEENWGTDEEPDIRQIAYIPSGAIDNGSIYEVTELGVSYGWTGSTWDALGTSHIDTEARRKIEELYSKLSKIEELLGTEVNEVE